MPGSFFPAVIPFNAFDGGTVALDGETITGSAEAIRSPWINAGTLARVRWTLDSGTFTSVKVRRAPTLPPTRDDQSPFHPVAGEQVATYEPSSGSVPAAPWSATGTGTASVTDGRLTISTSGATKYYNQTGVFTSGRKIYGVRFRVRRTSSHSSVQSVWIAVPLTGASDRGNRVFLDFRGSLYGANAGQVWDIRSTDPVPGISMAVDEDWDFLILFRSADGTNVSGIHLWAAPAGSAAETDLSHLVYRGQIQGDSAAANYAYFGEVYRTGTTSMVWGSLRYFAADAAVDEYGWEDTSNGDTAFARDQDFAQLKGTLDGTLSKLDIANDLTAPADLTLEASADPDDGTIKATIGGGSTGHYHFERTGPSTGESEWHHRPGYLFTNCEAGSHTVEARQATSDGVLSVNPATATITSPGTAPSVAVTVSPATIAAGETAAASAVLAGGASATINGSNWDGSSTTVVTATAGDLIGPTAPAPTIGQWPTRDRPSIRWSNDAMRIYYSATQPATYTLQRRAYPSGTSWATDSSQGTNPVDVADLTYDGSTPGTSYATDHGWTLATDGTYEYRILPTYSDGSIGQPSVPILPNDASDYEITVGGDVPLDWYDATTTKYVRVELSHVVTIGGREYLTGGATRCRGAVTSDGTWSISGLPRLASAARADGGDAGSLHATFIFPDGKRVKKVLPDQATATFASLTAYTG